MIGLVFAAMSESTISALPPSIAFSRSGAAASRKSSLRNSTPAIGFISRMSSAITRPLAPARRTAISLQPPGAAPRSTTRAPGFSRRYLSSISASL
jgi:hypothetical protein